MWSAEAGAWAADDLFAVNHRTAVKVDAAHMVGLALGLRLASRHGLGGAR